MQNTGELSNFVRFIARPSELPSEWAAKRQNRLPGLLQNAVIMSDDTKKRYSDEELEEFRAIVTEKLEKARQEYNDLVGSAVDNSTSDEVMAITNSTDAGVDYARNVEIKRLADRQLQFIRKLEGALQRIDNKSYGICRVTGKLIPKERLRAVPHATLSIEAKSK